MKIRCIASIKIITDNDYCISCGVCVKVCPFNNIKMEYGSYRGKWDAIVQNNDKCIGCNGFKLCLDVCPSYETDYTLFNSQENKLLGQIVKVYNGYSTNSKTRYSSSSGGFIIELSKTLLRNNLIQGIVSLVHYEGLEYYPSLITNENALDQMPNSIYHNINFENAINIIEATDKKVLLIGLPCQLTGIRKLLKKRKYNKLNQKIYATVALICGYSFDRTNMYAFAALNSFKMKQITYRENGRFRKTRIDHDDKSSSMFEVYNPSTIKERLLNSFMFDKSIVQTNCLYCVDHLGYGADIVVGDAWQARYKEDVIGTNIIITRTEQGEQAVSLLSNFTLEPGYKEELIESQHLAYALASKYNAIRDYNPRKNYYVPNHKRSNNPNKEIKENLTLKEKFVLRYIKPLLRKQQYRKAWIYYLLFNLDMIVKSIIKRVIRGRI